MSTASSARDAANDAERQESERASGQHAVALKRPTEQREQASVQRYFDRFAEAMTVGDWRTMSSLWGVPAFVLGRYEARVVQSESVLEPLFQGAKAWYEARGRTQTRAEIQHLDWVARDLVVATVRLSHLNDQEDELGEECSSYTLLRGEDGSYKLRSVLLRSAFGIGAERVDGTEDE